MTCLDLFFQIECHTPMTGLPIEDLDQLVDLCVCPLPIFGWELAEKKGGTKIGKNSQKKILR